MHDYIVIECDVNWEVAFYMKYADTTRHYVLTHCTDGYESLDLIIDKIEKVLKIFRYSSKNILYTHDFVRNRTIYHYLICKR